MSHYDDQREKEEAKQKERLQRYKLKKLLDKQRKEAKVC